jgi:hypothetical protein
MLAMHYTLRANNLDPDEICVLAQHVQGAFFHQQQRQQQRPYYQQHQHQHQHQQHQQQQQQQQLAGAALSAEAVAVSGAMQTTAQPPLLDSYTLQLLWLIGSGAQFTQCYLDSSECILWPKQDAKLLKLLIDAGAKLSQKLANQEEPGNNVHVSSSQVCLLHTLLSQ